MSIYHTLKRPLFRALLAIAAVAALSTAASAADIEGSQDHPLVGRYEGSETVGYRVTEYDEAKIIEAPFDGAAGQAGPGFKTIEGRNVLIYYKLPQGRSSLEVLRNFESSLTSKGFTVLFTCATSNGTCFTSQQPDAGYFLGSAVGDPLVIPKFEDDYVQNWFEQGGRYLLARADRPEGAVFVALYLGESNRGTVAVLRVVETKQMEANKIVFLNASQMDQAITGTGRVNLYGILFDLDKDTLRPDSKPTLDEIAALLKQKPALKIKIVGHTDNQGTADYNLDLSRRRAANVVSTLVTVYGVAPERLTSEGAGLTQPVAPNDTPEGQAKNRRVELIGQ